MYKAITLRLNIKRASKTVVLLFSFLKNELEHTVKVNVIFRMFRTVYNVNHKRFRASNVPDRLRGRFENVFKQKRSSNGQKWLWIVHENSRYWGSWTFETNSEKRLRYIHVSKSKDQLHYCKIKLSFIVKDIS